VEDAEQPETGQAWFESPRYLEAGIPGTAIDRLSSVWFAVKQGTAFRGGKLGDPFYSPQSHNQRAGVFGLAPAARFWYIEANITEQKEFNTLSDQKEQDTSTKHLAERHDDPTTSRIAVARDLTTLPKQLENLATDPDVQVRAAVASNPNTPWSTLEELAGEFPHAFLHNPARQLQVIADPEQISRDEAFWGAVLREAVIPSWWRNWLRSHPMLRLHIQEVGETTFPDGFLQEGEEIALLSLVRLLTVPAIQKTALPLLVSNAWELFPRESLLWLAREADIEVRRTMASDQQMPMEVMRLLAHDHDIQVRVLVARNQQIPVELLVVLAADEEWQVREAVVANIPPDTWTYQLLDADAALRREMAEKALTVLQVFVVLLARETEIVRVAREAVAALTEEEKEIYYKKIIQAEASGDQRVEIAGKTLLLAWVLVMLATDNDEQVRAVVAEHRKKLVELLVTLGRDESKYVRRLVAQNLLTPVELLIALAQDSSVRVRSDAARNTRMPVEVLVTLADDEEWRVREAVAQNPLTPVEVLVTLADDDWWFVLAAVAENERTPSDELVALAQDEESPWWLAASLARNPQTPVEVLIALAQDKEAQVREAVARNPQTPVEVLITLAQDKEVDVRQTVAQNPLTPVEALRNLTHYEVWWVRKSLAATSWTPAHVFRLLAQDENEDVRSLVARNLQAPTDVLVTLAQDEDTQVRSRVAWNPRTPMAVLATLAQDEEAQVRWWATLSQRVRAQIEPPQEDDPWWKHVPMQSRVDRSGDPWVPMARLAALAQDEEARVRWWATLSQNPHTLSETPVGNELWRQDDFGKGVISASATSRITEQLAVVARLPVSDMVRQTIMDALAGEWNAAMLRSTFDVEKEVEKEVDRKSLEYLATPFLTHLAAPFLPPLALHRLAASPSWQVRYLVALHQKTPAETRQQLSQDGNRYVRAMTRAAQMAQETVD